MNCAIRIEGVNFIGVQKLMDKPDLSPIDQQWIKRYVDSLIEAAKSFGNSAMGRSALVRADHVMDLVKAWRERKTP